MDDVAALDDRLGQFADRAGRPWWAGKGQAAIMQTTRRGSGAGSPSTRPGMSRIRSSTVPSRPSIRYVRPRFVPSVRWIAPIGVGPGPGPFKGGWSRPTGRGRRCSGSGPAARTAPFRSPSECHHNPASSPSARRMIVGRAPVACPCWRGKCSTGTSLSHPVLEALPEQVGVERLPAHQRAEALDRLVPEDLEGTVQVLYPVAQDQPDQPVPAPGVDPGDGAGRRGAADSRSRRRIRRAPRASGAGRGG